MLLVCLLQSLLVRLVIVLQRLLVLGLLLLFLPGTWNKKTFPVYAAIYLYLIAHALNLVPMFEYFL